MNPERRLQERKQPEQMVFCKLSDEEWGCVQNLSEDGLCFDSLTPIQENDLLHLRLSVDVDSAVEATGQLTWIDSAKRTGGLRFLELSAPAREQIRAWLGEPPAAQAPETRPAPAVAPAVDSAVDSARGDVAASTAVTPRPAKRRAFLRKRDQPADSKPPAAENPVIWQEMHAPSLLLVPIERYRAETRQQFLRGVLVGFGIFAVVTIPVLRYTGGWKSGSAAPASASASRNRATPSSADQSRASVAQPAATYAPPISEPSAAKARAALPAAVRTVAATSPTVSAQRPSPLISGAASGDPATRTSAPLRTQGPANAERSTPAILAQPLTGTPATMAAVQAASEDRSSADKAPRPKLLSATPEQLWSAVQAGNIKAAVALADLYARGEGVPVNCDQARILLMVASEKHNAEASKKLQELEQGGCPATPH